MSVDYTHGVVGRDPIAKTITQDMIAAHPDWTDKQIALAVNRHYEDAVINAQEVAHWRKAAQ